MLTGIAAFMGGRARGAEQERARIVTWLRAVPAAPVEDMELLREVAALIENGAHDRWAAAQEGGGGGHLQR